MPRTPTFRRAARAALRATLALGACHLLAGILLAQCTGTTTTVTNQTYSSGATQLAGNNSLSLTGVTVNGSATVTAVAGNCVQIQPASEFHSQSGAASFSSWVETTPSAVSVAPSSGTSSSLTQSFTFTASSPLGAGNLSGMFVVVGQQLAPTGTCYFYYNLPSNSIYLADASGNWQPAILAGSSSTIANPQCTINGTGSGYTPSGTQITATVSITFAPTFAGTQNIYLDAFNDEGLSTDYQTMGTWTVPQTYTPITLQSSPPGLVLSLGGQNCVAPCNYSVPAGQPILVSALPQHAPTGTYYVFSGWSDSGAATHTISSPSGTYTATMAVQDFTLSMSAVTGTVILGGQASYTISVINANPAGNFTGTVVLTTTNIPAGATATFSPCASGSSANACIWTGSGSVGLTVTTAGATVTNSTVVVNASSGVLSHNAGAPLSVQDYILTISPPAESVTRGGVATYTITATGINGYAGPVNVTADLSGLSLSNQQGVPATIYPGQSPATATLTTSPLIYVDPNTHVSSYSFGVQGNVGGIDGHGSNGVLLTVTTLADFTLTTSAASQSATPGSTATFPLTITPLNGFAGYVTLNSQYLPSPFVPSFGGSNQQYVSNSSPITTNVSIPVPSGIQPGTYQFNIQGSATGQGSPYNLPLVLIVTGGGSTFTLTATPNQQTIVPGGSATFTVTPTGTGGFNGTVLVAPNGGPPGTTITPANISLPAGQPGTFTVQTTSAAAIGNYTITFTGGYLGATQGTAATLTVAPVSAASMISPIPAGVQFINYNGNSAIVFEWDNGNGVTQTALSIDQGAIGTTYINSGASPCPPLSAAPHCAVVTFSSVSTFKATLTSTTGTGQLSQMYTYVVSGPTQSPNALPTTPRVARNGLPSAPIDLSLLTSSGVTGCTAQSGLSVQLVPPLAGSVVRSVTVIAAPTFPMGQVATAITCSTNTGDTLSNGVISFSPKIGPNEPMVSIDAEPAPGSVNVHVSAYAPSYVEIQASLTVTGQRSGLVYSGPVVGSFDNTWNVMLTGCDSFTAVLDPGVVTDDSNNEAWDGTSYACVSPDSPTTPSLSVYPTDETGVPGGSFDIYANGAAQGTNYEWALFSQGQPGDDSNAFQFTSPASCQGHSTCSEPSGHVVVQALSPGFTGLSVSIPGSSQNIRLRAISITVIQVCSDQFPGSPQSNCLPGDGTASNPNGTGTGAGMLGNSLQLLPVTVRKTSSPGSILPALYAYFKVSLTTSPSNQEAWSHVLVRFQSGQPLPPGTTNPNDPGGGSTQFSGSVFAAWIGQFLADADYTVVGGPDRWGVGQQALLPNSDIAASFYQPCPVPPAQYTVSGFSTQCFNGAVRVVSFAEYTGDAITARAGNFLFGRLFAGPLAQVNLGAFISRTPPTGADQAYATDNSTAVGVGVLHYNTGLDFASQTSGTIPQYTFGPNSMAATAMLMSADLQQILFDTLLAHAGEITSAGTKSFPVYGTCQYANSFSPRLACSSTYQSLPPSLLAVFPPIFPCIGNSTQQCQFVFASDDLHAAYGRVGQNLTLTATFAATSYPGVFNVTGVSISGTLWDYYQWETFAPADSELLKVQSGFGPPNTNSWGLGAAGGVYESIINFNSSPVPMTPFVWPMVF